MDTTPDVGGALHSAVDLFIGFGSDVFIFIAIVALALIFAFYFGRDRLVPLIAGIYVAIPLYTYFPYADVLKGSPYFALGFFALLIFVSMLAFSGLAGFIASGGVGLLKMLVLSALVAGLLMAIGINLLPVKDIHAFSAPTVALFSAQLFFWWLVAPVAGVFLFGK